MAAKAKLFSFSFLFLLSFSILTSAQNGPRITSPISTAARANVLGSKHSLAKVEFDRGAINPSQQLERLVLLLGASPEQDAELKAFLDAQQTAGSEDFHRWLTPEEFGRRFGPDAQDVQQVKGWLEEQGFTVSAIAGSRSWIEFSGTAAQVSAAFATSLHQYEIAGAAHVSNASELSVPAALSPVVRGMLSLNDFFSKPMLARHFEVKRNDAGVLVPVGPQFTLNTDGRHFLAPADFATIYNTTPLYQQGTTGLGKTIAIVGRSKVETTDVQTFRKIFGLPDNDPQVIVNGADPGFTFGGDAVEASLDVQWAGAVAPAATIKLVVSSSSFTTDGVALSAAYIVDKNLADVVSVSFGECEQFLSPSENAFWSSLWQQAAAQGMSVFVASGDTGAAGCDFTEGSGPASGGLQVNAVASTPYNTAVGGTEFQDVNNAATFWAGTNGSAFSSAIGYIPEAVWNESCDPTTPNSLCSTNIGLYVLAAGGGGASKIYTKPAWQLVSGVPSDGHRDLPDVSLAAGSERDGYLFCFSGSCQTTTDSHGAPLLLNASVVGGTSASAPSFAGIAALIDQKTGSRQGLANYLLYKLAASETFSQCDSTAQTDPTVRAANCIFNDITSGTNTVPGQVGFNAVTAFDLATGLGSVNATNLVSAWISAAGTLQGSSTALTATFAGVPLNQISFPHGSSVAVTVQVQSTSGSGVPTGDVSFVTDQYGAIGVGTLVGGTLATSLNSLPGGTYNLTAHYPGDATFSGSDSVAIPVTVTQENSTLTLSTSLGDGVVVTLPYASFFSVFAKVAGTSGNGRATGTVTFFDGNTQLSTVPLNSLGIAELPVCSTDACLNIATHVITAKYSGDNSLVASNSTQPLSLEIVKTGVGGFLQITSPFAPGDQWSLQVFLFGAANGSVLPTGTVEITDDAKPLAPAQALVNSSGNVSVTVKTALSPGTHNIAWNYSGDSNYAALNTQPFPFTVLPPFEMSATNTLASIKLGQSATYNVNMISNYGYSGSVTFTCSGMPTWATCNVSPRVIQVTPFNTTPVVVTVSTTQVATHHAPPFGSYPVVFAGLLAGLVARNKKCVRAFAALLVLWFIVASSGCGGGGSSSTVVPTTPTTTFPQTVAVVVTATDGKTTTNLVLGLQANR